MTLSFVELN